MIYALKDLLMKMGAPEAAEKHRVEWFYFDKDLKDLAGFAGIRFEMGGEQLVAEMKHIRDNHHDDDGVFHALYTEYFHMTAERTARPGHYRVTSIAFDGSHYGKPSAAVIELGLGVFHARALDISLAMIEQSFNKQDMLQKHETSDKLFRSFVDGEKETAVPKPAPRRFSNRKFSIKKGKPVPKDFAAAAGMTPVVAPDTAMPAAPTAIILPFRPRTAVARAS